MNISKINGGLEHLSDDLISGAITYKREKKAWIKWSVAAACFCLVIAGIFAANNGLFSKTSNTATLPGSFLADVSKHDEGAAPSNYQVLLSSSADIQGDTTSVCLVSSWDGLSLPFGQDTSSGLSAYVAPSIAQVSATNSMSIEEAKEYAYLDYDSATPEIKEKILAARNVLIFSTDWVADGYSGCIQDVETGENIKTLPTFSELFPGWNMPVTDTAKGDVTEDGLGADALYGLILRVLDINETGIICNSTESMNMFAQDQRILVIPPESISTEALSLKTNDTIFVSYYGKNCSVSETVIIADSITKA